MYKLEDLQEKFVEHAKQAVYNRSKLIKSFKENHPKEDLPEHFKDEFSLPMALATICRELINLKKRIER